MSTQPLSRLPTARRLFSADGIQRVLPYVTQLCAEAGAFLRNLLLARLAGIEAVGLAASFALVLRLAEMLGALGLDRQLARLPASRVRQAQGTLQGLALCVGVLLGAMLLVLGPVFSQSFVLGVDPHLYLLGRWC